MKDVLIVAVGSFLGVLLCSVGPLARILDRVELRWRLFLARWTFYPEDEMIAELRKKTGINS